MIARGIDVELELNGMILGPLLVGREDAGLCSRNGEGAGEVRVVGVKDVIAIPSRSTGIRSRPFDAGDALVAFGPHPLKIGNEAEGEICGMDAIEFVEDDGACAELGGGRRKHDLANSEADVGVGEDGAVGADLNGAGLLVHIDGNAVALDSGFDGEVREQLDRQNPGFEGSILLTEKDAAFAGDGVGLFGLSGSVKDRPRSVKGERGEGGEGGGGGLSRYGDGDGGRCGKEQESRDASGPAAEGEATAHGVVLWGTTQGDQCKAQRR